MRSVIFDPDLPLPIDPLPDPRPRVADAGRCHAARIDGGASPAPHGGTGSEVHLHALAVRTMAWLGTWQGGQADPGGHGDPEAIGEMRVMVVRTLSDLERLLTGGWRPDLLLSRLFWSTGDALETARLLSALEYRGRYRAVVPPLPRPDIVRDEVRRIAPGLDFDLLPLIDPGQTDRSS